HAGPNKIVSGLLAALLVLDDFLVKEVGACVRKALVLRSPYFPELLLGFGHRSGRIGRSGRRNHDVEALVHVVPLEGSSCCRGLFRTRLSRLFLSFLRSFRVVSILFCVTRVSFSSL